MKYPPDDQFVFREWCFTLKWMGWRRCLWLSASIDFHVKGVHVILFGVMIAYHKKLRFRL